VVGFAHLLVAMLAKAGGQNTSTQAVHPRMEGAEFWRGSLREIWPLMAPALGPTGMAEGMTYAATIRWRQWAVCYRGRRGR
jgi:hypothetical protein